MFDSTAGLNCTSDYILRSLICIKLQDGDEGSFLKEMSTTLMYNQCNKIRTCGDLKALLASRKYLNNWRTKTPLEIIQRVLKGVKILCFRIAVGVDV